MLLKPIRCAALLVVVLLLFVCNCVAQPVTLLPDKVVERTTISYRSFVTVGEKLLAVNDNGQLISWDLQRLDTIGLHVDPIYHFTAIAKDRNGSIYLTTDSGFVFFWQPGNGTVSLKYRIPYPIRFICFNSKNEITLATSECIYNPVTKQKWTDFKDHGTMMMRRRVHYDKKKKKSVQEDITSYFNEPEFAFLDSHDRWWLWENHGEFGTDLELFDTRKHKIIPNHDSRPENIQSFFEDDADKLYVTEGLQHMDNWGAIYRINDLDSMTNLYDSYKSPLIPRDTNIWHRSFIGPGIYNSADHKMYFFTNRGFYRTAISTHGLVNVEPLFSPMLKWSNEPKAVGAQMAVRQITFLDANRMLFLTMNNGFGLYNGKHLVFLK